MIPLADLSARWPALEALLDEAMDLAPAERERWFDALAGEAAQYKDTLRQLLASHARVETGDFLGTLPKLEDRGDAATRGEAVAGDLVGPYRLISELGRGGMGTVWLAERSDGQLRRPVSLKLPRVAWGGALAQRLARERDILATLEHPHIARLYDAGVDALGRPWLAIEHVQGLPIDRYCREQVLDVKARLALLLQVAQAVAYAHSRLVIHRDLKPSNILVTEERQVRLLDFGIAKLLEGDRTEETDLTREAGQALTLAYASPEQVRGQPLGTTSDVYSLAVVAYELLTGAPPYRLERGSAAELEEQIASRGQAPLASAVATDRGTRKQLRGDLDAILNKALKKEPDERYASVEAMAADIQRHLAGDAVAARPDAPAQRAARWLQRHRRSALVAALVASALGVALGVGATALVIAALAGGLLAALWQARRARLKAEEARQQAARAKAVQDFVLDIFRANSELQADPKQARQTTARELLDRGAARLETALHEAPEARLEILATLREMYNQMQLDEQAVAVDRRRIALLRQVHGGSDRRVAEALVDLAAALHATPWRDEILPALQEAQAILDALGEPDTPLRAELATGFARRYQNLSFATMQQHADEAVRVLRAQPRRDPFRLGSALHLAARARALLGQPVASEAVHHEALEALSQQQPVSHVALCQVRGSLGQCLIEQFRVVDAEAVFQRAGDDALHALGEDDVNTLFLQSRLALAMHLRGHRAPAMALHRRTLERTLATRGPNDTLYTPGARREMAASLLAEGVLGEALALIESVNVVNRKHYAGSSVLAGSLRQQCVMLVAVGDWPAAGELADEMMAHWQQGSRDGVAAWRANRLHLARAQLELARGRTDMALEQLACVVPGEGFRLALPADEFERDLLCSQAWLQAGEPARALDAAQRLAQAAAQSPAPIEMPALLAATQLQWARTLCAVGQPAAALAPAQRAASWHREHDDATSPWTGSAELVWAESLLGLGRADEAAALVHRAAARFAAQARLGDHLRRPLHVLQQRLQSLQVG